MVGERLTLEARHKNPEEQGISCSKESLCFRAGFSRVFLGVYGPIWLNGDFLFPKANTCLANSLVFNSIPESWSKSIDKYVDSRSFSASSTSTSPLDWQVFKLKTLALCHLEISLFRMNFRDQETNPTKIGNLLGQWLNFKLFGITYLVGKISRSNFFFQGPLAEWGKRVNDISW